MQKISSTKKYTAFGIIIAALIITIWSTKSQASKKTEPSKIAVKTIITSTKDARIPLEISGFVRGENRADISPMASGRILRIFKREGESVKKGEVLATIESIGSDAQIMAASSSVKSLEKTLGDSEKYYDQLVEQAKSARNDSNSDTANEMVTSAKRARDLQIQATKSQLVAAQGALGMASANKSNFTLIAPFAGTITTINGREGGFANFSMPLINLSTKNSFEIETYVSPSDGRNITLGSIASFQSSTGTPVSAVVTAVSPGADQLSLKTLVRMHLDNTADDIVLGDFLHGQILLPTKQAVISIPKNAIVSRGGDSVIFMVDENNVAKEQAVKTGAEYDGSIEILEGIMPDQKIVIEGQQHLANGTITKSYEKK